MTMTVAPPPPPQAANGISEPPALPPAAPAPPAPPPRRPAAGGIVGGLILIALGLVFLSTSVFAAPGALLFIGLGGAFLVARIVTGNYGFAVPAGVLLGFGAFVGMTEYGFFRGPEAGGIFFVMLGVGFMLVYLIGARPSVVWPILPSVALVGFGMFIQTVTYGWPLEGFAGLAQYWPLAIVAVGVWLLARDYLPPAARVPVAVVGASVLILIGLLVAAAGIATVANPALRGAEPIPWSGWRPLVTFGSPPLQDTVTLSAPLGTADSITVANTSGRTVVRAGSGPDVTVRATRHFWADAAPDVQLVPQGTTLAVDATQRAFDVRSSYVDYVIELPTSAGANVRSTSGSVEVAGVAGATVIQTTSGSVRVDNVSGDLRITTTSGDVRGAGLDHPRQLEATSGTIDIATSLQSDSRMTTSSGDVRVRFTGDPSARIDVVTSSGAIRTTGLTLTSDRRDARTLTGTLGSGTNRLDVRTSSGSVSLTR